MKRTIDMLLEEHRIVANFSSVALLSLVLAMLSVGVGHVLSSASFDSSHPMSIFIGLLLGTTLALSLFSMVIATFFVVKKRREVIGWGSFLAIIWILPYIGISAYLGGANFLAILRGTKT